MIKLKLTVLALFILLTITLLLGVPKSRSVRAELRPEQDGVTYLDQGWGTEERQAFYHTSQGSRVLPYRWFMALEQASLLSRQPFLSDDTVRQYRLISDHNLTHNPDGLPVGFVKDVSPDGEFISVTCAACHTGQINFNGAQLRIDGGPAMHNLNGFFGEMFKALAVTKVDPLKFARFARKVLGNDDNLLERQKLRLQVGRMLLSAADTVLTAKLKRLYPTVEGFGRLDALGRGGNLVLGSEIGDERNLAVANAPVGFPHLWGTPSFDWVQWNGSIQQPMARNLGEALGVNTPVTLRGKPGDLFQSAVKIENLALMEKALERLNAPRWPEEVLGRIDRDQANRGATLYAQHCAACHESRPAPPNEFGKVFLRINLYPLDVIGTDATDAVNFNTRVVHTGQLGLPAVVPAAGGLQVISSRVAERKYDELRLSPEQRDEMNGFRANKIRAPRAYRARNMDGIWATAPYLHNNSVPNLYQLLLPASQRAKTFFVGNLEYDPRVVGFRADPFPGGFALHTDAVGNSNAGHEFRDGPRTKGVIGRLLTDDERWALIEYLKTR